MKRAERPAIRPLLFEWLGVVLVACSICAVLVLSSATARLDNLLYDALVRVQAVEARQDILVVAIDDTSLEQIGPWPWPRATHAQLIERLDAAGARAIGYDVLFVDPSPSARDDQALAKALAAAGNVCLSASFIVPGYDGAPFTPLYPIDALAKAAFLGHAQMTYDQDGVARGVSRHLSAGPRRLPHLSQCVRRIGDRDFRAEAAPRGDEGASLVRDAPDLIPFPTASSIRVVPAVAVIRGEVPAAFISGHYVLVGATAGGMHDTHVTPVIEHGSTMPGVMFQASVLNALLGNTSIHPVGPSAQVIFGIFGVVLIMLGFAMLPTRYALPFTAGVLVLIVALSAALLAGLRLWAPPTPLVLTLLILTPLWGWRRLEAVSSYMLGELQRFAQEPDVMSASLARRGGGGDHIARQIQLLGLTIGRVRELRRFAGDTLMSLPDATFVTSLRGRILFANGAAQALWPASPIRTVWRLTPGWRRVDGAALALPAPEAIGQGWTCEVMSPDGRPFLAAVVAHRDSTGSPTAWLVRLTDVTDLRAAAEQREQVLQLLSHDIRSPQSSILALLAGAPPGSMAPDMARKVSGYAHRTLSLAANFVHIARSGSDALSFELLDLADILTEAIDELWPKAQQAGVRLQALWPEDEEFLIHAERSLLTRAFINLMENALRFSPSGGVVTCGLRREGAVVVASIHDEGPGMSAEACERLFQPFYRAKNQGDGFGLGLTLVRKVAQRHKAAIKVASAPGQGATFQLTFALA